MNTEIRKLVVWAAALIVLSIIHEGLAALLAGWDPMARVLVERDLTTAVVAGGLLFLRTSLVFVAPGLIVFRLVLVAFRLTRRTEPSGARP